MSESIESGRSGCSRVPTSRPRDGSPNSHFFSTCTCVAGSRLAFYINVEPRLWGSRARARGLLDLATAHGGRKWSSPDGRSASWLGRGPPLVNVLRALAVMRSRPERFAFPPAGAGRLAATTRAPRAPHRFQSSSGDMRVRFGAGSPPVSSWLRAPRRARDPDYGPHASSRTALPAIASPARRTRPSEWLVPAFVAWSACNDGVGGGPSHVPKDAAYPRLSAGRSRMCAARFAHGKKGAFPRHDVFYFLASAGHDALTFARMATFRLVRSSRLLYNHGESLEARSLVPTCVRHRMRRASPRRHEVRPRTSRAAGERSRLDRIFVRIRCADGDTPNQWSAGCDVREFAISHGSHPG